MTFNKTALNAALTLALASVAGTAFAGSSTGKVTIEQSVREECIVHTATELDFGSQGLLNQNYDAQATFKVQCSMEGKPYTIYVQDAAAPTATTYTMTKGSDEINFEMYQDSSRTTLWTSSAGLAGTSSLTATNGVLYGRIPVQVSKPAGAYLANINYAINF